MSRRRRLGATAACLLALAFVALPAAAAPVALAIQGHLRTTAGGPVADGNYALAVALYAAEAGGQPVFLEKFIAVGVAGGVFSVDLGVLDPGKQLDDGLFFAGQAQWVGVQVGAEAELPRRPLRAVPYAVHARGASQAYGLQCSGCVEAADLAPGAVTSAAIAAGAVQAAHTGFAWAAADQKGGSALHALAATQAKLADAAKAADVATSAEEAKSAQVANKLACTGCVGAAMLADAAVPDLVAAGKLAQVAVSGDYADLQGTPGFGTLAGANTWTGANGFAKVLTVNGVQFAKTQALQFRFENAPQPPAACAADTMGLAYFDTGDLSLYVCNGKDWFAFATTVPPGSVQNPAASCKALLAAKPGLASGVYWLDPDKSGPLPATQAWCDMTSHGGGWTLAARMVSGSWCHIDAGAAGTLAAPNQGSCAKLSDAAIRALYSDQFWLSCGTPKPERFGKIDDIAKFDTDPQVGNKKMTWSETYGGPTYGGTDQACCNLGDHDYHSPHVIYSIAKGYNNGNYKADWSGCYNSQQGWHQSGFLYVR